MANPIPTILRGDDSGSIDLTMATGRTYTGATLVVAYQGVTRKFTNLTPGGTVSLMFTHSETAAMTAKTAPVLMRLIGATGGEETVENAEARIKVTDNLAEVNAGGSFTITPGAGITDPTKVPITDVGDLAARYSLADLKAKVDQIVRVLAQRSLLALAAAIALPFFAAADVEVQTARLDALWNDSLVVTNVTGGGGGGGTPSDYTTTNAVKEIVAGEGYIKSWTETDPVWTADKPNYQPTIADLATIRSGAALGATAVQPAAIADMETKTHATATYQPMLTSGTNIKTINGESVLGAGDIVIQGGGAGVSTNAVNALIANYDATNLTERIDARLAKSGGVMTGGITFAEWNQKMQWGAGANAGSVYLHEEGAGFVFDFDGATTTITPDGSSVVTWSLLNSLTTNDVPDVTRQILSQSGRDCAGKIADATNAVTKVLKVTQGDAAWEYNGTEEVQIDLAQGGGTDGAAVTNIVASIFPSNRVFGVSGGLLTAYDVSADGARTNEIWREARGYALTNGYQDVEWKTRGLDGTITTITIGDAATAAAGVSVDLPSAWDAEARDFAVYVFNGAAVAAPLRLPTNATIYGYYASATNALKANAATALYFTEISRNTFLLGRAELTKVQEAAE